MLGIKTALKNFLDTIKIMLKLPPHKHGKSHKSPVPVPTPPKVAISASEIEAQMTLGPAGGCHPHTQCGFPGMPPHQGAQAPFAVPNPNAYWSPPLMQRTQFDLAVQDRWCASEGNRCTGYMPGSGAVTYQADNPPQPPFCYDTEPHHK